ncbi:hypothetical protein PMIT1318_00632 [Prochlorococcus marinus str. MIT 1318]|uniref:hypothetical protein n=1 Tax=Prochlorococcus TaxID=1218 RepID=UPI0007B39BCE|nr:hypothetical protein [Prochlorococcus marinus]KZR73044.1 hypothetical protein PMIT1318_00632 [Prochlorococcus marinus str. MIT 1318]
MNNLFKLSVVILMILSGSESKADFGDADFPTNLFNESPKSYHDAWCRKINNKCRIRFQGPSIWVEGQGGIHRSQFISYHFDQENNPAYHTNQYFNYIKYIGTRGNQKTALFIFANLEAQGDFMTAFSRWKKQDSRPIPNYRLPASQGPQETHGRDKGLNPYDNPPITDWKEKTTE